MNAPRIPRAAQRQQDEPLQVVLPDGEVHLVFPPEAANDEPPRRPGSRLLTAMGLVLAAYLVAACVPAGVLNAAGAWLLSATGVAN